VGIFQLPKLGLFQLPFRSDKVLKPYGLNERFILEMPFKFPNISTLTTNKPELEVLKKRILKGINLLKRAKEEYDTTKDVDKIVNYIRQAADRLYNFPNATNDSQKKALYKIFGEYLIEKSSTGSNNISEALMTNIFDFNKSLFDISSKGPHAVTQSGETMEYHPKYEDADMLLGITSFVYYFLAKKFERCSIIN